MANTSAEQSRRAIEAVWRIESARLIGGLARLVRDIGVAEDLAQEALIVALERWPSTGVPDNPGAWLMTTAKHRALDRMRRAKMIERKHAQLAETDIDTEIASFETAVDENVGDDLLRLILVACHPVLSTDARAALTLRMLGGLTTEEIARAFLVGEPTVAQRIVRAKRTLSEARVTFEVPQGAELSTRLGSVLEVIYLIFNEGYAASSGEDWIRPQLCEDALRLGRILAGLVPNEAEVHGLVALMELQASRARARTSPDGQPILLLEQDRGRWDQLLIHRGLAALSYAWALRVGHVGPYTLQAEIAARHARARRAEETDWVAIVALYDALVQLTGSPVVELNRAVAVSMADGPAAGLELVDELADEPALRQYHLLFSVRGHLLFELGRKREARAEFERAAALTGNSRERELLLARARAST
jgi:RNA polymerase sigma-70 factor, ECF subfamily